MSDHTCPSAPAQDGAVLLGVKGADGRIKPMRTAMVVDAAFLEAASALGPPEARMRFATPCQKAGCAQWTGTGCGVIASVLAHLNTPDPVATLPPCLIRATCRWWAERGAAACGVCDLVITDQTALSDA